MNPSLGVGGTTLSEMDQTTSRKEMLERAIKSALKGKKALALNSLPCICHEITSIIELYPCKPDNYEEIGIDQWTEVRGSANATIQYHKNVYVPSIKIEFVAQISNCTVLSIDEPIRADLEVPIVL